MAPSAAASTGSKDICDKGGADNGLIFPAGGNWEADLARPYKITLYGLGLVYCFAGVAIVSEVFMSGIEAITSKKRRVYDRYKQRYRTVKVWNETVSNLTLIALGSSAPEILLNVIEVVKNGFFAGELGPGTIVGSAAFNLLVITAVCVVSIPNGEVRIIKDVPVYAVTAFFSIFAYIWMLIILLGTSKNVILIWEAVVTLLFFPVLVFIAFCADKGWIGGIPAIACRQRVVAAEMTREELAQIISGIKAEFGDLDDSVIAVLVEKRTAARPSKAAHRAAQRRMSWMKWRKGSFSSLTHNWLFSQKSDSDIVQQGLGNPSNSKGLVATTSSGRSVVEGEAALEFATTNYAVKECGKHITAEVQRYNDLKHTVSVRYRTVQGTATANADYKHKEGVLEFGPSETLKTISVEICDDNEWEQAEDFHIELYDATCSHGTVAIGPNARTTVTIIDDDDPGMLAFETEFVEFLEHGGRNHTLNVTVNRKHGSKGEISCQCTTENASAVAPLDYDAIDEKLTMKHGEISAIVPILIKPRGRYDLVEEFRLILHDPEGCRFDKKTDGDEEMNICTIQIKAGDEHKMAIDRLAQTLVGNWDKAKIGYSNWQDQFIGALYVGGSAEEQKEAGCMDWIMHLIQLPWKLLFAIIPPTDFSGGWLCFIVALFFIGGITAAIGDLASLFGCVLEMPGEVTAITFVALGTSLPDTFASRSAAIQDPYADASITNITGSNSVNVFLGLGLPWTFASIYWAANGQDNEWRSKTPDNIKNEYMDGLGVYVLTADSLGFSVGIFTSTALCAVGALWIRRGMLGGELGGPTIAKYATSTFLVLLWMAYIAASWIYTKTNS